MQARGRFSSIFFHLFSVTSDTAPKAPETVVRIINYPSYHPVQITPFQGTGDHSVFKGGQSKTSVVKHHRIDYQPAWFFP